MKKLILCASLVCLGMMSSCTKDELVPADEKPEWLGKSIYEELQSGAHLTGTFNTYLRLVDDLGYSEVLSRTGSKTIFPANDAAFQKFFASPNALGVSSYSQLTTQQKKLLLYSSMLDNAMLTGMLSNVDKDDNSVTRGVALKHTTNLAVADYITTLYNGAEMPQNNVYWDAYRTRGINVVYDATKTMMVHFTNEQMLLNNISTEGLDCDFGILRGEDRGTRVSYTEVKGSPVTYVFQNKVIDPNMTCTNGYIHQVEDVIVPPGNLAQVLRAEENTKLFSRILDYHCAPYYDPVTTNDYNAWARQNGQATIDSIFQVRYFASAHSQNNTSNTLDPSGNSVRVEWRLPWDPGWNQYYPSSGSNLALADMGAILVPTDEAIEKYFLPGGGGAYFIELYGADGLANTKENLPQNLDALFNKGNGILTTFLNNLMQTSFIASVPSKFGTITNLGSGDFMGLTLDSLAHKGTKYDVVVANNGVIYKLKSMVAPDEYQSVIGPALVYPDMSVMKYFASDKTQGATNSIFGADLYYYLMAMKANYAFFIPSNSAMKKCYIDPMSLGTTKPRALEFYDWVDTIPGTSRTITKYGVKMHEFNIETGEINPVAYDDTQKDIISNNSSVYKSQVADLLNYNTVVLSEGEQFGKNKYYLTKHGGAIRIDDYVNAGGHFSGTVSGGAQIDNNVQPAKIENAWSEKNGIALRIDGVIQPSITSVYKALSTASGEKFKEFLELCGLFENQDLLEFAGIPATPITEGSDITLQTKYIVFTDKSQKALDNNVNFFNGYNYTFFAPNNTAMDEARAMGLPTVGDIERNFEKYNGVQPGDEDPDDGHTITQEEITEAKAQTLNMINVCRAFVRYHFMNNSVFADNYVAEREYQSMYSSELGIPVNLTVKSSAGVLTVKDETGTVNTVNANGSTGMVNKMTRDYEFDKVRTSAQSIAVSSFAAVHEISTPLCFNANGRYDNKWATTQAKKVAAKYYKQTLNSIKNF